MTQELMEMAKEAGFELPWMSLEGHKRLVAFAKLVAAQRTEDISRYCMWLDDTAGYTDGYDFANAIRVKFQDE